MEGDHFTMSKSYRRKSSAPILPEPLRPVWRACAPYLAAILFFAGIMACTGSLVKVTAAILVPVTIVIAIVHFRTLSSRITLPLVALALVVLMDGLSAIWAVSGKFALTQFLKPLASFCIALLLLCLVKGEGAAPGRRIAAILERAAALTGLISIDLFSTRILSTPVLAILGLFCGDFNSLTVVEAGTRMTSLLENPNVFASFMGLGVLMSLGLALSSESKGERTAHVACLFLNSLSFVLAFSLGASGFIAAAFLVYLALETRQRRADLFLLMVETFVLTLAAAMLVSATSFQKTDAIQPIPILCAVVGAVALCAADRFVGERVTEKLRQNGKILVAAVVLIVALLGAYAVAGMNVTGAAEMATGEHLRRSAYPAPGQYTLSVEADGELEMSIISQNRQETMMHTNTSLYTGKADGASFTVPEDSLVVYFDFTAAEDLTVSSMTYAGPAGSGSVPLDYKLLPGFITTRLQGLFANQNAIQRLVFFEDGMKLFRRSPVIGLGKGSYESALCSAQSFYYETRYAHNHYVQSLCETGVIGCALFVLLIVVSAAAVLFERRKKEQAHPLTAALGAALVLMAGHAFMEVTFSYYAYLPMAFAVFALIGLCCADAIPAPKLDAGVRGGVLIGSCALMAVFAYFLYGNMLAANIVSSQGTFQALDRAIELDKYEWTDYMLSYVTSASNAEGDEQILARVDECAERLTQVKSNIIPYHLAGYYFWQGDRERAMAMVEKYVTYVASDPETWNKAFELLEANFDFTEEYTEGVKHIYQLMLDWNAANLGEITLGEQQQSFLTYMGVTVQ